MTVDSSDVAVIIVNYNSADFLRSCLSALATQTHPPKRVVVIDNGSTDDSMEGIENFLPGIEIRELRQNVGYAAASNLGVRLAEDCRWVAFLNADAFPENDWLERLTSATETNPQYSFFASCMLDYHDSGILDGAGDEYHVSGLARRRFHGQSYGKSAKEYTEVFSPCGGAALYHRDTFLRAGAFDESYFCYFEDIDLGFRMRLLGEKCLYVPDAIVRHVGWGSTEKRGEFSIYHGHRNMVWTYFKNMPALLFWIYLPLHVAVNIFSILYFLFRRRGKAILKAKWDALRRLWPVIKERRDIQKSRKVGPLQVREAMAKGIRWPLVYIFAFKKKDRSKKSSKG